MTGLYPTLYQNRFESLMGNPNFYGNYSAVIFLITIYFLVIASKKEICKKKYFFYFVSIVNLIAVFITQNRSALLGIAAAYFFIVTFNYLREQYAINFVLLRKSAVILMTAMIVVFLLHKTGFFIMENRMFDEGRRTADEISSGRISIWMQAVGAISERPFFGWGVENFAYTTKYAPVGLSASPWQDRVHNIFLEILVYNGLIGFFIFIYFLIQIGKGINLLLKQSRSDHLEALFIMYFIYYFVNDAFTFDDPVAAILFVVLLAYLASTINIIKNSKPIVGAVYFKIASLFVLIMGMMYNVAFHLKNLQLSRDIYSAVVGKDLFYLSNNKPKLIIEKVIDSDFYDRLHELELLLAISINAGLEQPNSMYKDYIYQYTDGYVMIYLKNNLATAKTYSYISQFYSSYDKNDKAIDYLSKAIEKFPNNLMLFVELGKIYEKEKKTELAKEQYLIAISKDKLFSPAVESYNRLTDR